MILSNSPRPQIFGTGLIALDLVISAEPAVPVRAWAGGTCGNVLSILAMLGWEAYPIARMNGDPASRRIRADMKKWGVQLTFASCRPTADTPIIIQHVLRARDGSPKHRFAWACPQCGHWLPGFKAVTKHAVDRVSQHIEGAEVFFMDRVSRSALQLAEQAASTGAMVIFEPSAKSDAKLFAEAVKLAHIVKYSDERFSRISGAMTPTSATLVEVQTLGASGLRYRHRFDGAVSTWKYLDAVPAADIVDTCGSGDWCTAGFISTVARNGTKGFVKGGTKLLAEGLLFGQRLAAWNAGFEGARGGMYAVDRGELEKHLSALASGRAELIKVAPNPKHPAPAHLACPACAPRAKQSRLRPTQMAKPI